MALEIVYLRVARKLRKRTEGRSRDKIAPSVTHFLHQALPPNGESPVGNHQWIGW